MALFERRKRMENNKNTNENIEDLIKGITSMFTDENKNPLNIQSPLTNFFNANEGKEGFPFKIEDVLGTLKTGKFDDVLNTFSTMFTDSCNTEGCFCGGNCKQRESKEESPEESILKDFNNPFETLTSTDINVNVLENNDSYQIEAQLPGVEKKDIHLDIEDGILTITVDKGEEFSNTETRYLLKEFTRANLVRKIILPKLKGAEFETSAILENGILYVGIQILATKKPKNVIEIN